MNDQQPHLKKRVHPQVVHPNCVQKWIYSSSEDAMQWCALLSICAVFFYREMYLRQSIRLQPGHTMLPNWCGEPKYVHLAGLPSVQV